MGNEQATTETPQFTATYSEKYAPHSVEISANAKGELSYSVKVYSNDEHDAAVRAFNVAMELRVQIAALKK